MISIIIPAFNSNKSLFILAAQLKQLKKRHNYNLEIIFVDDGSTKNTWNVIKKIKKLNSNKFKIIGIKLDKNYGQHYAQLAGIDNAKGKIIITMDDDLQHPTKYIPKIFKELNNKKSVDLVYALDKNISRNPIRILFSLILKTVLKFFLGNDKFDKTSSFCGFKSSLKKDMKKYRFSNFNLDSFFINYAKNIKNIYIDSPPRKFGKTNYSTSKLFKTSFDLIFESSNLPLKISNFVGILFSLVGILIFLYVVLEFYIYGIEVKGFVFLSSIISIFFGIQFFALTIMGSYLYKIIEKLYAKPNYKVEKKI